MTSQRQGVRVQYKRNTPDVITLRELWKKALKSEEIIFYLKNSIVAATWCFWSQKHRLHVIHCFRVELIPVKENQNLILMMTKIFVN
jgi:hypothetical protein